MEALPDELKKLRALERCLETFKGDRTQITNRLESEKDSNVRQLLEQRRDLIDIQITELETSMKELRKTEQAIDQSVTLLESIPGIALTTAFSLPGRRVV